LVSLRNYPGGGQPDTGEVDLDVKNLIDLPSFLILIFYISFLTKISA
jgi:hypothetical protein